MVKMCKEETLIIVEKKSTDYREEITLGALRTKQRLEALPESLKRAIQ